MQWCLLSQAPVICNSETSSSTIFCLFLTCVGELFFASWLYLVVGMAVSCLASKAMSSIVWLRLLLLNITRGYITLTFSWVPHRDIFLAEVVSELTERLRDAEGLSTGKLNRGVSQGRIFPQNKAWGWAWGWRPRSLHRIKESQNHMNSVSTPNIQA